MAEYIPRETAKEELLSWARCINHPEHLMTEDAMCVLDNIPAADVAPVVHGNWEVHPKDVFATMHHCGKLRCTNCWHFLYYNFGDDKNYCPNCGARMDGE